MARRKTEDPPGIIARENAIKVLNQILSSRRSLEEVINLNSSYQQMEPRDRAFVRLWLQRLCGDWAKLMP